MIETKEQFDSTLENLAGFDSRLRNDVRELRLDGVGTEEIEKITDPQVSFYSGMHEEATAYAGEHGIDLSAVNMPATPGDARSGALAEELFS